MENRKNPEKEVIRLEQIHKQSPTPANLKALVAAKTELNMDHTRHIQNINIMNMKSSRLLAYQQYI